MQSHPQCKAPPQIVFKNIGVLKIQISFTTPTSQTLTLQTVRKPIALYQHVQMFCFQSKTYLIQTLFAFVTSEIVLEVKLSDDCDKCYHQKGGRCQLDSDNKFLCALDIGDKSSIIKLKLGLASGLGGLLGNLINIIIFYGMPSNLMILAIINS